MPEYVERFGKAFPGEKDPVTFDNMAKAVEAFEATLITPNARFDQWLAGKGEALRLPVYMDKGCASCHAGVNLGGQGYFPFGLVRKPGADILPSEDKGRFDVTKTAADSYVLRAAPLRNIALTAPYLHSGEVWDLKQAVAVMGTAQIGAELTDEEGHFGQHDTELENLRRFGESYLALQSLERSRNAAAGKAQGRGGRARPCGGAAGRRVTLDHDGTSAPTRSPGGGVARRWSSRPVR